MKKIDSIISHHIGFEWYEEANIPVVSLRVLLDRIQEEGFSLRRTVWEIIYAFMLNTPNGSIWLNTPSQNRVYVMDLIGHWGDLSGADDHLEEDRKLSSYSREGSIFVFYNLIHNLRLAIEQSGLDPSNLPS